MRLIGCGAGRTHDMHSDERELRRRAVGRLVMVTRFLQAWDPAGVVRELATTGNAPDEYDAYAGGVLTLLAKDASVEELFAHFVALRADLGLAADTIGDYEFAAGLHTWWQRLSPDSDSNPGS
jgi:hypothetical protein